MQSSPRVPISFLVFALLLWCFLGAAPFASSQATSGTVLGQIRIAPGNGISKPILVTLKGRGVVIGQSYTDQEGNFSFSGLPGNVYHVVVEEEDYLPVNLQVALDTSNGPMRIVNVYLVPRKTDKPQDSPLPGENPYLISPAEYGKLYPGAAVKEFQAGAKAEEKRKPEEAIKHYEKAISLAPSFYAARNNLGTLYLSRSEYDAAQKQFEQVIAINPTDASACFNLANVHLLRRNYADAELLTERGLNREPNSAFGHFLRGSLYNQNGKLQQAESSLRRALELDPKMAQAHLALVNLFLQQKRNDDAISELRNFLKEFPEHDFSPKARQVLKRLEASDTTTSK